VVGQILVHEVTRIHRLHLIEMMRGSRAGREINRLAPAQSGQQVERGVQLLERGSRAALFHRKRELPDRLHRRPTRQAIVGHIEKSTRSKPPRDDPDRRLARGGRYPGQHAVHRGDIDVAAVLRRIVLEARLRECHVLQFRAINQTARVCDILRDEIASLERHVGIGRGKKRKTEALPEPELEYPTRMNRHTGRASADKCGESDMARRHLSIEACRIWHVGRGSAPDCTLFASTLPGR
jgi:hypothetical protein